VGYFFIGKQKVILFPKYREIGWKSAASALSGSLAPQSERIWSENYKCIRWTKLHTILSLSLILWIVQLFLTSSILSNRTTSAIVVLKIEGRREVYCSLDSWASSILGSSKCICGPCGGNNKRSGQSDGNEQKH
jgi:hypothetical protein